MTLSDQERDAVVKYRLEKSYNTLEEAEYVSKGNYWNLAANRLYYTIFYACEALLLSRRINASTHAGVGSMMSLHFVKTGLLTKDEGKLIGILLRMRQTGDYDDLSDWTEEEIVPMFPRVRTLLKRLESLIPQS